jgi:hypothetical protein
MPPENQRFPNPPLKTSNWAIGSFIIAILSIAPLCVCLLTNVFPVLDKTMFLRAYSLAVFLLGSPILVIASYVTGIIAWREIKSGKPVKILILSILHRKKMTIEVKLKGYSWIILGVIIATLSLFLIIYIWYLFRLGMED